MYNTSTAAKFIPKIKKQNTKHTFGLPWWVRGKESS